MPGQKICVYFVDLLLFYNKYKIHNSDNDFLRYNLRTKYRLFRNLLVVLARHNLGQGLVSFEFRAINK